MMQENAWPTPRRTEVAKGGGAPLMVAGPLGLGFFSRLPPPSENTL